MSITAQNIANTGDMRGTTLALTARDDLRNIGGALAATEDMRLSAGRDIVMETTTASGGTQRGSVATKAMVLDSSKGKEMSKFPGDWKLDPQLVEGFSRLISPRDFDLGNVREWWAKFPRTEHYAHRDTDIFDFRYVELAGLELKDISLAECSFDGVAAQGVRFINVGFQESTARNADFSNAQFVNAQMSRFFCLGASFVGCRI